MADYERPVGAPMPGVIPSTLAADRAVVEAYVMAEPQREFIAKDDPGANGRVPLPGEHRWTFKFPLEDGTELWVYVGDVGFKAFEAMLAENRAADAVEIARSLAR